MAPRYLRVSNSWWAERIHGLRYQRERCGSDVYLCSCISIRLVNVDVRRSAAFPLSSNLSIEDVRACIISTAAVSKTSRYHHRAKKGKGGLICISATWQEHDDSTMTSIPMEHSIEDARLDGGC